MSWSTDASGRKTWVPWIVGTPANGDVPVWSGSTWVPTTPSWATAVTTTSDPISTDVYSDGKIWVNTTKNRVWRSLGSGEWVCLSDPGLVWEWNGTDLTQFDIVEEASFTRTITTFTAGPAAPAIKIANPSTGTPCMSMLVKTAQLPPSFWTKEPTICYSMVQRSTQNTAIGTQDLLAIPYYESMSFLAAVQLKATADTWTRRNNSTTWSADSTANTMYTRNSAYGIVSENVYYTKIPTASTDPQCVFRRISGGDGMPYFEAYAGSWSAAWRSLSWNPRIGWGCRAYGSSSTGNYLGGLQIRLGSVGPL